MYKWLKHKRFLYRMKRKNVFIGKGVFVHWDSRIKGDTVIGDYTRINGPILIKGKGRVEIGKYCAIGEDVRIITTNHLTNYANIQMKLQKEIGLHSFN